MPWSEGCDKLMLPGTYTPAGAIGQIERSRRVGGYLYRPPHLFERFLPSAHHLPVGSVIRDRCVEAVLNVKRGPQYHLSVPHAPLGLPDAPQILVAPCEQVSEEHDMVARVHL